MGELDEHVSKRGEQDKKGFRQGAPARTVRELLPILGHHGAMQRRTRELAAKSDGKRGTNRRVLIIDA